MPLVRSFVGQSLALTMPGVAAHTITVTESHTMSSSSIQFPASAGAIPQPTWRATHAPARHLVLLLLAGSIVSQASAQSAPASDGSQAARTLALLPVQDEIELALGAAPAHLRADATVYTFGPNGYAQTRQGNNGFTCLVNRDGQQSGETTLRPTCWDREGTASIVPVMLRVGALLAQGTTADEIKRDIDLGFTEGRLRSPSKTGIAYMLLGDIDYAIKTKAITTLFPPHYMVYAPGVSNADIGLNKEAASKHNALPFVYSGYSGGTRTAYLIIVASPDRETPKHPM